MSTVFKYDANLIGSQSDRDAKVRKTGEWVVGSGEWGMGSGE